MSVIFDRVFHDDGYVRAHADNDHTRKRRGLGEEVEVPEGKVEFDWFLHRDDRVVLFLVRLAVRSDENVARPDGPRNAEADPLLPARDGAGVSQDLEVADDPLKLFRVHLNGALVGGVGDAKLLALNVHQLQVWQRDAERRCFIGRNAKATVHDQWQEKKSESLFFQYEQYRHVILLNQPPPMKSQDGWVLPAQLTKVRNGVPAALKQHGEGVGLVVLGLEGDGIILAEHF